MITNQPLVSVVVPAYNAERHLCECLESVVRQTYTSWQLVVVDDGSTDSTRVLAEAFVRQHPDRVRVLSTVNQGLSMARNHGTRMSSGDMVAYLDSDDIWMPRKLEKQIELLQSDQDAVAATCGLVRFMDGRPERYVTSNFQWTDQNVDSWLLQEGSAPGLGSTLIIRREALTDLGEFDASLGSHAEDLDFGYRLHRYGRVMTVPELLTALRVWSGQIHVDAESMDNSLRRVFDKHMATRPKYLPRAEANVRLRNALRLLLSGEVATGIRGLIITLVSSPFRSMRSAVILTQKQFRGRMRLHAVAFSER
jgi:glycosyltransferase involved in cell wall biosynthesis